MGLPVTLDNWGGGYSDMLTPWQQAVWANTKDAAQIQANDNQVYRDWYAKQRQAEITWQQVAMIAVRTAIDLTIADQVDKRMREIARDNRDLADRQLKMGEELHARYIGKYAPVEDLMADFAKNDWETNRYKPQYELQQGRARVDAARAYGKVAAKLNKKFARYCTGANANMLRSAEMDRSKMEVDMVNRSYRKEEAIMWDRDDLQWKRLHNVVSFGRGLSSEAAADIANGIRTAQESNAIRGEAMQGWYGALSRSVTGLYNFGFGALEQQRAMNYSGYARSLRSGSLGNTGFQTDGIGLSPNAAIENSGAGFSSLRALENSMSVTDANATGADTAGWYE